ncbi:MAG TPA: hypothetical protein VF225_02410 [Gaiellaceae bacterium]
MPRRLLATAAICIGCAATAANADGGGPGAGVQQGWDGLANGAVRYVAVPAAGSTALEVIRRQDGRVLKFMALKGTWGIPVVAFDGTADGLMGDGRTLLLGEPTTGPALRKHSTFALVDLKSMKLVRKLRLPGHQVFDALSPDGRYLYFIEYVSAEDFNRYRVRAYDLHAGRLLARAVIDKRESETAMQGAPISRVTSQDRTWAYTLYGGPDKTFIHALDTMHAGAVCIDLPWKSQPKRLFEFRIRRAGDGRLVVRGPRGRTLAVVDRNNLHVVNAVRDP